MLYPTHQKYGILFGILTIPVIVLLGFIPTISPTMRPVDIVTILLACFVGIGGALFGARFPDIDSPTSIPARRHPIIRKIFAFFKIKHRGKYSHDYATIGATFLVAYLVVAKGGEKLLHGVAIGNTVVNYLVYVISLGVLYLIAQDIIDFVQWLGKKFKQKKLVEFAETKRVIGSIAIVAGTVVLMVVSGLLDISAMMAGNDITGALTLTTIATVVLKVYVIMAWSGAYSHLFADMTTKEGVRFFGIRMAPAQVMLKVKKVPLIGKLLIPTDFKTGSSWEDFNARVVKIACIPSAFIAVLMVFGFDLSWLMAWA